MKQKLGDLTGSAIDDEAGDVDEMSNNGEADTEADTDAEEEGSGQRAS